MNRSRGRLAARTHRRLTLLLMLVVVGAGLYVLVAGESGYLEVRERRAELKRLRGEVQTLRSQNDSLQTVMRLLAEDLEYLEKVAREEYGMKKPGERVYRLPNFALPLGSESE